MGIFLFAILIIIIGIVALVAPKIIPVQPSKVRMVGGALAFIGVIALFSSMVILIDAGEVGTVIIFGRVEKTSLKNGIHLVPPYANIVRYPIRLREYSMTGNQAIDAKVNNGLGIIIDSTTLYTVDPNMVGEIYAKVAKSADQLEASILLPTVRNVIRDTTSEYSAEEIYSSNRQVVNLRMEKKLRKSVAKKGIIIDKFMIRKVQLPPEIDKAIQMKIKAQQEAKAMEYKKDKAIRDAEIKIIEADGLAKAQKIINSTLSPNYLQHEAIQAYKALAGSSNTTFIIMPTSSKSTGMPLILNAKQ